MTTLLLIEDNELIRNNTAEILELTGYRVQTAENGKIGVEKALAHKPDLVICDIMMPVLDGYGVLHIFNKNPSLAGVPFIFLSAKIERTDFRKGMELGADDYLTKPFEESELLSAIEGRLNRFRNVDKSSTPEQASRPHPETPVEGPSERLKSEYDLQQDGLAQFLLDARQVGSLQGLSVDRKIYTVRRKQYVYSEGEVPTRLYFIQSGRVKTLRANANGKEFVTGLYNPGDFFGYIPLLEESDYTDSAVTLDAAELVYIPKSDFQQLLLANPAVSGQFIKLLAGRVAEREGQLLGMAYNSLRRRVADTLLNLHEQQPEGLIQLSREDLAAMVGTVTESVIRTLTEFKGAGFIQMMASGAIRVVEPEKLRAAQW